MRRHYLFLVKCSFLAFVCLNSGCVPRIRIPRDGVRVMMAVVVDEHRTPDDAIRIAREKPVFTFDSDSINSIFPGNDAKAFVRRFESVLHNREFLIEMETLRKNDLKRWIEVLLIIRDIDKKLVQQIMGPLLLENKALWQAVSIYVLKSL